jgi:hypothetical protein
MSYNKANLETQSQGGIVTACMPSQNEAKPTTTMMIDALNFETI